MSTPFDNDDFTGEDFASDDLASGNLASGNDALSREGAAGLAAGIGGAGSSPRGLLGGVAGAFSTADSPSHIPPLFTDDSAGDRNNIITARGTAEGLVLRIDGRVSPSDLLPAVKDFLASRRSFLAGHDVAFEWIGKKADEALISNLTSILSNEFSITVRSSRLKVTIRPGDSSSAHPDQEASQSGGQANHPQGAGSFPAGVPPLSPVTTAISASSSIPSTSPAGLAVVGGRNVTNINSSIEKTISLFDGMEGFDAKMGNSGAAMLWDEPDARLVYGTLRSGQKIETEHSVVVFGDVNSGAEVIAGGDIVILGTLRGIAHAGAYDESGGGRVIFALNLQPTQLRIGLVISRGTSGDMRQTSSERSDKGSGSTPEIARVDNNMIVVELYQSRTVWVRRRE